MGCCESLLGATKPSSDLHTPRSGADVEMQQTLRKNDSMGNMSARERLQQMSREEEEEDGVMSPAALRAASQRRSGMKRMESDDANDPYSTGAASAAAAAAARAHRSHSQHRRPVASSTGSAKSSAGGMSSSSSPGSERRQLSGSRPNSLGRPGSGRRETMAQQVTGFFQDGIEAVREATKSVEQKRLEAIEQEAIEREQEEERRRQEMQRLHDYLNHEFASGWLQKRGTGKGVMGRQNWKRRWFVIKGSQCKYYASAAEDEKPKGVIDLSGCTVKAHPRPEKEKKGEFQFDVHPPPGAEIDEVRALAAASSSERERWMRALQTSIEEHAVLAQKHGELLGEGAAGGAGIGGGGNVSYSETNVIPAGRRGLGGGGGGGGAAGAAGGGSRRGLADSSADQQQFRSAGWLKKQGRGEGTFAKKNWKRRYFQLKKDQLYYYAKEDDDYPKVSDGVGKGGNLGTGEGQRKEGRKDGKSRGRQ